MSAARPSIYLDTNILSTLHYTGQDVQTGQQHSAVRSWWETERRWFRVFASKLTEAELSKGQFPGQKKALAEVRRLAHLQLNSNVTERARAYLDARLIPPSHRADAFQLAFAAVYMIDYLLTWNCAHLASAETQIRLEELSRTKGWSTPLLVSPLTVPRRSLGQAIRRSDA